MGFDCYQRFQISVNPQADIFHISETNLNFQELGVSVHSITGALKQFFTLLPDPLVPVEFYQQILNSMGKFCLFVESTLNVYLHCQTSRSHKVGIVKRVREVLTFSLAVSPRSITYQESRE